MLATIDARTFEAKVAQAKADLAAAKAALSNQEAALKQGRGRRGAARNARRERQQSAARTRALPRPSTLDTARATPTSPTPISPSPRPRSKAPRPAIVQREAALEAGPDRSRAHQDRLADRRHGDLAHRRSGPDGRRQPAGAGAVQDRPGSAAHPHRGAGQRSRRRRRRRGQSGDVHRRRLSRPHVRGQGHAGSPRCDRTATMSSPTPSSSKPRTTTASCFPA